MINTTKRADAARITPLPVDSSAAKIQAYIMNWDQVEGNWNQHKGKIMSRWGKLTDDDIETIKGKRTELLGLLQKHYGRGTEQAQNEIDLWLKKLN